MKKLLRSGCMLILTVVMIFTCGFPSGYRIFAEADNGSDKDTVTRHRVITAVMFVWGAKGTDGRWHWNPEAPGGIYNRDTEIKLGRGTYEAEFIPYVYNVTNFDEMENVETQGAKLGRYHEEYGQYAASDISGKIKSIDKRCGRVKYSYNCRLEAQKTLYDATKELQYREGVDRIRALIGNGSPELDKYLKKQRIGENVKAYIYFMPYILKYKVKDDITGEPKPPSGDDEEIPEMSGKAILRLPKYAYEGEEFPAKDDSQFRVNGELWGAKKFYELGYGNGEISPESGGKKTFQNSAEAGIVFSEAGKRYVDLKVQLLTGEIYRDRKNIEIRPVPYVEDLLSGGKKQNRAGTLTARVHIKSGTKLKSVKITLENISTGEKIYKEYTEHGIKQGENTEHIKTRDMQVSPAGLGGNITECHFKFMSKPKVLGADEDARLKYTMEAEDEGGKTHSVEKEFVVKPDLPPKAKIKGNEKFFRSAGGGNAEILMEDDSISDDGDQHERIWSITGDCQGIENRSFQTNRKVAIKKKRVGKAVVTLKIKDKWKEETLEEYVTDNERLSSEVNKNVEVDNKAPKVGLKPVKLINKNILIFTENDREHEAIGLKKNKLADMLAEHGADAKINVMRISDSARVNKNGIEPVDSRQYAYGYDISNISEAGIHLVDKRNIYTVEYVWSGSGTGKKPVAPAILIAKEAKTGKIKFKYVINSIEKFSLGQDNEDEFIYLIFKDRTVLINKENGQEAGVLPYRLGEKAYSTWKYIYTVCEGQLWQIDKATENRKKLDGDVLGIYPVRGTLQYAKFENDMIVRYILYKDSGKISRSKSAYKVRDQWISPHHKIESKFIGIDSDGKIAAYLQVKGYTALGYLFIADNKNNVVKESLPFREGTSMCMAADETGRCNYVSLASPEGTGDDYRIRVNIYDIKNKKMSGIDVYPKDIFYGGYLNKERGIGFEVKGKPYFIYGGGIGYTPGFGIIGTVLSQPISLDSGGNAVISQNLIKNFGFFEEYIKFAPGMISGVQALNDPENGSLAYDTWSWHRSRQMDKEQLKKEYMSYIGGVCLDGAEVISAIDGFEKAGKSSSSFKNLIKKLGIENGVTSESGAGVKSIFAKGERVHFDIKYTDFENDKSKAQFWQYIHEPKKGSRITEHGKILARPIERFEKEGKYTLTHWQKDDCGVAAYNKESNKEKIVFYIEGEIADPEIPQEEEGIKGFVKHTDKWNNNRKSYNTAKFKKAFDNGVSFGEYLKLTKPRPRFFNVFWSGEIFKLTARVKGKPKKVLCKIEGDNNLYVVLHKKNNEFIGELWNKNMPGRWGNKNPELLKFRFTAEYEGGKKKEDTVNIIMDSNRDYWDFHRKF